MKKSLILTTLFFALILGAAYGIWIWFFCRIDIPAGHMAIVTSMIGDDLPSGQILAEKGQKGIMRDPLPEGRYFYNPVNYRWKIVPLIHISCGKIGVVTSKTGKELPDGEIIAPSRDYKGIWKNVLGPGTYRLNPHGYAVEVTDAISIPIGFVGVLTSQIGKPARPGQFAQEGEKGVKKEVLQPGLYYINPREYRVDIVEVGMNQISVIGRAGSMVVTKSQIANNSSNAAGLKDIQRLTLKKQQEKRNNYVKDNFEQGFLQDTDLEEIQTSQKKQARNSRPIIGSHARRSDDMSVFGLNRFVEFPSRDGFQILLDMTVEFELLPENISLIYMNYGDLPAVVDKIILPQILSISRLRGSSYQAKDFINGEGREEFQQKLKEDLTETLAKNHIVIHNAIIRHVEIPTEILTPIQETSLSREQNLTNIAWQATTQKQAKLNTQESLIIQTKMKVAQETKKMVAEISANKRQIVADIDAQTNLQVANIKLQEAKVKAEINQITEKANIDAKFVVNDAKVKGERLVAKQFGSVQTLANLKLVENLNPKIKINLIHSGEGTLWTDLKNFSPAIPVKTAK